MELELSLPTHYGVQLYPPHVFLKLQMISKIYTWLEKSRFFVWKYTFRYKFFFSGYVYFQSAFVVREWKKFIKQLQETSSLGPLVKLKKKKSKPSYPSVHGGRWRFCIEYQSFNTNIIKDKFPILAME